MGNNQSNYLEHLHSTCPYLYHYTNESGMRGILEEGRIRPSTGQGDCQFGNGIYLTGLGPSHGKKRILANNYGPNSSNIEEYADFCLRFDRKRIPNVEKHIKESGRSVYLLSRETDYVWTSLMENSIEFYRI